MPFLTSDSWYLVTFYDLCKAPWKVLPYAPAASAMTLTTLLKHEPMVMYVENAGLGSAIGPGGAVSVLNDSLVESAVPLKSFTLIDEGDTPYRMAMDASGRLFYLDSGTGLVKMFDAAQAAALKAFL